MLGEAKLHLEYKYTVLLPVVLEAKASLPLPTVMNTLSICHVYKTSKVSVFVTNCPNKRWQ